MQESGKPMKTNAMSFRALIVICAWLSILVFSRAAHAIPEVAKGVAIPKDKGYFVGDLGEGLYWVTDGFYSSMFATTGQGVIVVDAPPTLGPKLLAAIADTTKEPVTHVIYSHSHADHIGSAGLLPKGITVIASERTKARLARSMQPGRALPYGTFVGGGPVPLPTVTFAKSYTLKVGKQVLELADDGDDHEPGNIYIFAPRQRVLMKVDIVFPGWAPFEYLAVAEDTWGSIAAVDKILAYDFRRLVAGHYGRLATRADVELDRDYLAAVRDGAIAALQSVDFNAIAATVGVADVEKLFGAYLGAVVDKCSADTVPKWKDRLGGVETVTPSHCHQLIIELRLQ